MSARVRLFLPAIEILLLKHVGLCNLSHVFAKICFFLGLLCNGMNMLQRVRNFSCQFEILLLKV